MNRTHLAIIILFVLVAVVGLVEVELFTVEPSAVTIEAGPSGNNVWWAALQKCPTNAPCIIEGQPGAIYYESYSPLLVGQSPDGSASQGGTQWQEWRLNGAGIVLTDATPNQLDDGIVMMPGGRLICNGKGTSKNFVGVMAASTANLRSVVSTPSNSILNIWQPNNIYNNKYHIGSVIYDSTSNTTQQIVACSGTCSQGTKLPNFNKTLGATTPDGNMTWVNRFHAGRWGTGTVDNTDIIGCAIAGSTSANAKISTVERISAIGGRFYQQGGTIGSCNGEGIDDPLYADHGACLVITDGLLNGKGLCGANGNAFGCCPSNCGGTSSSGTTVTAEFDNIFFAPGTSPTGAGNEPSYEIRVHGALGGVDDIAINHSQIADLHTNSLSCNGSHNIALVKLDGNGRNATFETNYFEIGSGKGKPECGDADSGTFIVDGYQDVELINNTWQQNGPDTHKTNEVLLKGSKNSNTRVLIMGRFQDPSIYQYYVNNLITGHSIPTKRNNAIANASIEYHYIAPTVNDITLFDGSMVGSAAGFGKWDNNNGIVVP